MANELKPYLVTYKIADQHGNLGPVTTTTVYAESRNDAKNIVLRKLNHRAVVTRWPTLQRGK